MMNPPQRVETSCPYGAIWPASEDSGEGNVIDGENEGRSRTDLQDRRQLVERALHRHAGSDAEHGHSLARRLTQQVAALDRIAAVVAPRRGLWRVIGAVAGGVASDGFHGGCRLHRMTRMGS